VKKVFQKKDQASIQLAAACLRHLGLSTTLKAVKDLAAVIRKYRADEQRVN